MPILLAALQVAVAVGLATWAVRLLRSPSLVPWPAIGVAALTCAICFTVGGATGADLPGPDAAIVAATATGLSCVLAAVSVQVPRTSARPSRVPTAIACAGIVIGALGLLLNLLSG